MGSKHAGIHLRCDDSSAVLEKLKKEFGGKKKGPDLKDKLMMKILRSFAEKNIREISDPKEKERKKAELESIMENACKEMNDGENAVIVVHPRFVSIYWYDRIRPENMQDKLTEYSFISGMPAVGAAIYDDTNFLIYAVRDAGTPQAHACRSEYMFDYNDIKPINADEICGTICAPFLLEGLKKVLSCDDGDDMAKAFETETGLTIYADKAFCEANGMKKLYKCANATVFLAK